jgi:hypothetical protein
MTKANQFCTLFDCNYLLKGVVMLQTLVLHFPATRISVLCMDEATHQVLSQLNISGVDLLRLKDVEDDDLLRVKPGRSIAEYCWTLSASLCWYVMQNYPNAESVTYLDADLMFFSDVNPIFDEIGNASIAIIEHRFMPRLAHLEPYGRFNVEWVSFKRDQFGLACLKKWRDQCIEWCFARLEDGKLGDQKYLDEWPDLYGERLHIIKHIGAGVAPWNFANHQYKNTDNVIRVDDEKLIFFHFHQFQLLSGNSYYYMADLYMGNDVVPELIYKRYEEELEIVLNQVRQVYPNFSFGIRPSNVVKLRRLAQKYIPGPVKIFMRRLGLNTW